MTVRQIFWWLVRAAIYYGAFEALAPFAITFGGAWPRFTEGAFFAVIASSLHARRLQRFGRIVAIPALLVVGGYLSFVAVWAAVTVEHYGSVFWPAIVLLFVMAGVSYWVALRFYRGMKGGPRAVRSS